MFFSFTCSDGTGKSTLLKAIISQTCAETVDQKPVVGKKTLFSRLYLLNVDKKDAASYSKKYSYAKVIDFEELPRTEKKACVVVEDIIHITKKEEVKLRNAINYQAHHKIQKIMCASHAIYKNQIYSLLAFFNFVIFTSALSNVPIIRNVFNYFKVEAEQIQQWLNAYKKIGMGHHGIYFYFDCEKMTFNVSLQMLFKKLKLIGVLGTLEKNAASSLDEGGGGGQESAIKLMQQQFDKFVSNFPRKNDASAIFSIIINCINLKTVRPHDLTVIFLVKNKMSKTKKLISIVDYINFLLSPDQLPTPNYLALHKYVQTFCYIPKIFICNKFLIAQENKKN
jgi:hypothetical protein